uniref:Kinesin-2 n=1 Tax=Anthurium amnicola TaxID=1678845 RepID=A0A1D1Y8M5_9ARAE
MHTTEAMFLSVDEPPLQTALPSGDPNLEPSEGSPGSPPPPSACLDINVVPEQQKEGLVASISLLQGQISELKSKQRQLDGKRREALNKILDIKGSIRVFCRVCPPLPAAVAVNPCTLTTGSEKVTVRSVGTRKEFRVDRVLPPEATQEDVFTEVEPILRSALDGHNVCIFAYGQTGTGKTYTMEGTGRKAGIVPRAIEELFRQSSMNDGTPFTFSMSMLEVYMGSLRDLLAQRVPSARAAEFLTRSLNIQTGGSGFVEVEGLTKVDIGDFKQASHWYAKGKRARTTSWTNVNEASSRSHCLTRITIGRAGNDGRGEESVSKLWMVDLGGSERLLKTGATGQTMDEGKAINLSLSALGDVIQALKRKRNHVPYRNSKLTQILKDSLGDGSKVLMLVHVSVSATDIGETICSLNFAKRSRAIESSEEVSEELRTHKEKCIVEFDQQMKDAEEELQKVRHHIQKVEHHLQEKKLLLMGYQLDDPKGSPKSPLILGCGDISESPQTDDKEACKNYSGSLPRFMTSTMCSRQRQNAVVPISNRLRTSRMGNIGSVDLFRSQSRSFVDPHSRLNLNGSKNRLVKFETNRSKFRTVPFLCNHENLSCNSVDSKSSTIPRSRTSVSHSNLRVATSQHRRRMSDLT